MKKTTWIFFAVVAMMMVMNSCREQSDDVVSYGQKDYLNFSGADTSYVEQFKALWTALNCNYGIWDYEAKYGLDWDAVYSKYLPKMQELDKRDKETNPVTNDELETLYKEILSPLHDGHIGFQVKNLHTTTYINISPSNIRNQSRPDYGISRTNLDYYTSEAAGQNHIEEMDYVSTYPQDFVMNEINQVLPWVKAWFDYLNAKTDRTDLEDYELTVFSSAYDELSNFELMSMDDLNYYNTTLTKKYEYLGITLESFDVNQNYYMDATYALFNDGIVYLGFSNFAFTAYQSDMIGTTNSCQRMKTQVLYILSQWIDKVQTLHAVGQLKGVIIDVRNNGGGITDDYEYILGSLLPEGGHQVASARFKTGIGRFDYSPITPEIMPTLSPSSVGGDTQLTPISEEPIVVLANCHSVSMSEVTCLGAKQMPNARVIGTQTWGGLCLLNGDPAAYSFNYAGIVGVQDETSFYAYIPSNVTIADNGGILEGVGVTPDIEIQLDKDLYETTGRDTQLERALQYIRTGN